MTHNLTLVTNSLHFEKMGWVFGGYIGPAEMRANHQFETARELEESNPERAIPMYLKMINEYPYAAYNHGCHITSTLKVEAEERIRVLQCLQKEHRNIPRPEVISVIQRAIMQKKSGLLKPVMDCDFSYAYGPVLFSGHDLQILRMIDENFKQYPAASDLIVQGDFILFRHAQSETRNHSFQLKERNNSWFLFNYQPDF